MYAKLFLSLLVMLCAASGYGQQWNKGQVKLKNGKVMLGEISYEYGQDAIMLKVADGTMVIPAFKLNEFSFREGKYNNERRFKPVHYSKGAAKVYEFYEVVIEGAMSLLKQQQSVWYSGRQEVVVYDYYVLKDDELMPINEFRRHVYPSLKKASPSLKEFVKQNKLRASNIDHNIKVIVFYNQAVSASASL
jgi:hypothetical protein